MTYRHYTTYQLLSKSSTSGNSMGRQKERKSPLPGRAWMAHAPRLIIKIDLIDGSYLTITRHDSAPMTTLYASQHVRYSPCVSRLHRIVSTSHCPSSGRWHGSRVSRSRKPMKDSSRNEIGNARELGEPSDYAGVFPYQRTQQIRDRRIQNGGTVVLFCKRR